MSRLRALLALVALAASLTWADEIALPRKPARPAPQWGTAVRGLQLGIAPSKDVQGMAKPVFDGTNVQFTVMLRNSGDAPVRLLPPIFRCLLGKGDPLFVSALVFTPKDGRPALTATFQGWNHLSLLDKNRTKGEQPHQTLNASHGKTGYELSPESAKQYTAELAPGAQEDARVIFAVSGKDSAWTLGKGAPLPAGRYTVSAVLNVDQKLSEWKGELATPGLDFELR